MLAPRKNRNRNVLDPNRRIISRESELRRIEGVRYEITILPIPIDASGGRTVTPRRKDNRARRKFTADFA
jgi:hypothetical protein